MSTYSNAIIYCVELAPSLAQGGSMLNIGTFSSSKLLCTMIYLFILYFVKMVHCYCWQRCNERFELNGVSVVCIF